MKSIKRTKLESAAMRTIYNMRRTGMRRFVVDRPVKDRRGVTIGWMTVERWLEPEIA